MKLAYRPSFPDHGDPASQARRVSDLDRLESMAIHILREVAAAFENPALMFSGGKDSTVLLHLAEKAFWPGPIPFPLLHIDTGHNFPEVIEFRDRMASQFGARLVVQRVEDTIARGRVVEKRSGQSRNAMQTVTLLDAINELGFDACIGGARRDEEKARAKERVFSFRNEFGQWSPREQRPELWHLYNTKIEPGQHMRVFPLSNWTEIDIWRYIAQEDIELPDLYYAHHRQVVRRGSKLLVVSPLTDIQHDERPETLLVRFRTVGDIS